MRQKGKGTERRGRRNGRNGSYRSPAQRPVSPKGSNVVDIREAFGNPDPRIRALTAALLRIVPVKRTDVRKRSRDVVDAAEKAHAAREARRSRP